jgi:hypothetical protein
MLSPEGRQRRINNRDFCSTKNNEGKKIGGRKM